MRDLARRAGRFAIVPVLAGAALFGMTVPAVAAPPAPQPQAAGNNCGGPYDGVALCLVVDKRDPAHAKVSALARSEGSKMVGALVVLEACDGVNCNSEAVATGKNTGEVRTTPVEWGQGVGFYRVNASWVDNQGRTHTGVLYPVQ
jgi:hypothetical protein